MSDDRNALSSFDSLSASSLFAVVMAGGPGSRLWPESRKRRPKPFLPLLNDGRSLFRATLDRLDGLVPSERRLVVAGKSFESLVRDVAPELDAGNLLLEPVGRDTAPCVAWAALDALKRDPDATLLVLPSDHLIRPDDEFRRTIKRAVRLVHADPTRLVTLGIRPTEPSSAYGYIELGARLDELDAHDAPCQVERFCEKPDGETARRFLASGRFLWNAGIFVWRARTFLELLERFEPDLFTTIQQIDARLDLTRQANKRLDEDAEFVRLFSNARRVSVDYAVLERAPNVVVLPVETFEWDDLGSFDALEKMASQDDSTATFEDVRCVGAAYVSENARGNFARVACSNANRRKLVAFVGVDDLLVVETDDVLLVAKKGDAAALKKIVEKVDKEGLEEYL